MFDNSLLKITNGLFNYRNYQSNIRFDVYFRELYQWLYLIKQNKLFYYPRIGKTSTIINDDITAKGRIGKDFKRI